MRQNTKNIMHIDFIKRAPTLTRYNYILSCFKKAKSKATPGNPALVKGIFIPSDFQNIVDRLGIAPKSKHTITNNRTYEATFEITYDTRLS